ncbi:MAG TPA: STAS domain-containing protein [Terriglobales bacterium]|jgi:anti-anti-sigma regulatory factor|nr:STAS domain-containing protein [Terriglobales bacterium]
MLNINVETFNDLAVVECKGRVVRDDDVFRLRYVVQAHDDARTIALDLSEVKAIGGGGLGMLAFLERWARENEIHLKLYCPSQAVLQGLAQNRSLANFEIATFPEMMEVLSQSDSRYSESSFNVAA